MADNEPEVDQDDVSTRAELLPEEKAAGSDDPRAQAEAVLAESEERSDERDADPEGDVERRTSDEVAVDPD